MMHYGPMRKLNRFFFSYFCVSCDCEHFVATAYDELQGRKG